ncbi:leucine-rich repeat domain-containing protein [Peptostreptococcaceae bacterium AGR-M142]
MTKVIKNFLFLMILILSISTIHKNYIKDYEIEFTNNHIKRAVIKELGKKNRYDEKILKSELDKIYKIDIGNINKGNLGEEALIKDFSILSNMKNIEYLNLSDCNIRNIESMPTLDNLKILYLNNNKIENIDSLLKFKNLEVLCLDNNNIKDISGISKLKDLKQLYIANNDIKNIEEINKLDKVEILDISNMEIVEEQIINKNVKKYLNNKDDIIYSKRIPIEYDLYSNKNILVEQKNIKKENRNYFKEHKVRIDGINIEYQKEYDRFLDKDKYNRVSKIKGTISEDFKNMNLYKISNMRGNYIDYDKVIIVLQDGKVNII